jgi:hypothetical protein
MWHKMLHPHDKDGAGGSDGARRAITPQAQAAPSPGASPAKAPASLPGSTAATIDAPVAVRANSGPIPTPAGSGGARGSPAPGELPHRLASVSEGDEKDRHVEAARAATAAAGASSKTGPEGSYKEWDHPPRRGSADSSRFPTATGDEGISIETSLAQLRSPEDNASLKHPDPNVRDPSPPPPPPIASRTNTDGSVASAVEAEGQSGAEQSSTTIFSPSFDSAWPVTGATAIADAAAIAPDSAFPQPNASASASASTPSTQTTGPRTSLAPLPQRITLRRGSSDGSSHRGYVYSAHSPGDGQGEGPGGASVGGNGGAGQKGGGRWNGGRNERSPESSHRRDQEKERAVLGFHTRMANVGQGFSSGF